MRKTVSDMVSFRDITLSDRTVRNSIRSFQGGWDHLDITIGGADLNGKSHGDHKQEKVQ